LVGRDIFDPARKKTRHDIAAQGTEFAVRCISGQPASVEQLLHRPGSFTKPAV
jgi:hypothetical protein